MPRAVFLQKHRDIIRLLNAGQSVRNTAKIAGKGVSTVQRVKAAVLQLRHHCGADRVNTGTRGRVELRKPRTVGDNDG